MALGIVRPFSAQKGINDCDFFSEAGLVHRVVRLQQTPREVPDACRARRARRIELRIRDKNGMDAPERRHQGLQERRGGLPPVVSTQVHEGVSRRESAPI